MSEKGFVSQFLSELNVIYTTRSILTPLRPPLPIDSHLRHNIHLFEQFRPIPQRNSYTFVYDFAFFFNSIITKRKKERITRMRTNSIKSNSTFSVSKNCNATATTAEKKQANRHTNKRKVRSKIHIKII